MKRAFLLSIIIAAAASGCAHREIASTKQLITVKPDTARLVDTISGSKQTIANANGKIENAHIHTDNARELVTQIQREENGSQAKKNRLLLLELDGIKGELLSASKDLEAAQGGLISAEQNVAVLESQIDAHHRELTLVKADFLLVSERLSSVQQEHAVEKNRRRTATKWAWIWGIGALGQTICISVYAFVRLRIL